MWTLEQKREYHRKYSKRWRAAHREQVRENDRQYYAANVETIREQRRRRRAANPEQARAWRRRNPEKVVLQRRLYRLRNREKEAHYEAQRRASSERKAWLEKNREKLRAYSRAYYAQHSDTRISSRKLKQCPTCQVFYWSKKPCTCRRVPKWYNATFKSNNCVVCGTHINGPFAHKTCSSICKAIRKKQNRMRGRKRRKLLLALGREAVRQAHVHVPIKGKDKRREFLRKIGARLIKQTGANP